jgi:hypothetical protein
MVHVLAQAACKTLAGLAAGSVASYLHALGLALFPLVVCTRNVAPDTLQIKDQKKVLGMPVVTRAGYSAARYHREWFTTNHFNRRWI